MRKRRYFQLLILCSVLLVELLDTSVSTCSLLLACVELMALGAHLDLDLRKCGSYRESVAAMACYCCLMILRMDICFHFFNLLSFP